MTDVLLISAGTTLGWRAAARQLAEGIAGAGAEVHTELVGPGRPVRTLMLTDLVQARAARRAAQTAIARHRPQAIVYGSITATLLWPTPGAIWLDSLAAENRPGRHGLWQRPLERRRLAGATLVMPWSPQALAPLPGPRPEAVVVPVTVERSGPLEPRDIAALVYAADPAKRRLDFILAAWARARHDGETLVVAGLERPDPPPGVRFSGVLEPAAYRALVRRSRVFVAAPRIEDFGIAALEALADGCQLVTTPAPGPYPALELARRLDPRLVAEDLAPALRTALDDPTSGYAERAAAMLAPYGPAAVQATIAERVLPRLLPGWSPR